MGKNITSRQSLTLDEVNVALAFAQPKLRAARNGAGIVVAGTYLLTEAAIADPAGPIAEFDIEIILPPAYPLREPKVLETGGRIPRRAERHVNGDGDCCVTVWEHWLATAVDHSFASFLNGPLHEYFLGQFWFERSGTWPFGERAHGANGMEDAYAEALGIPTVKSDLIYHLRLLAKDWPKGHWPCPCGSGKILRCCHRAEIMTLHRRVSPSIAKRMLHRLEEQHRGSPRMLRSRRI